MIYCLFDVECVVYKVEMFFKGCMGYFYMFCIFYWNKK